MFSLDVTKLTNVVKKAEKVVARCPACAARGGDATGNNLVVFLDGKFGCQAAKGDKEHNRQILELASTEKAGATEGRVPIRRVTHPPSTVIKIVGRLGRSLPTAPAVEAAHPAPMLATTPSEIAGVLALTETGPPRPADSIDTKVDEVPLVPLQPPGRPKVPQAILERLKRDAEGSCDVTTTAATPEVDPEMKRDYEKETDEILESLGLKTLPNGTIIDPKRSPGERVVGWRQIRSD